MVALSADEPSLARDLAMHVTAMRPRVVQPDDMPAEVVAKERELFAQQTAQEQAEAAKPKPQNILDRIIDGRVRKFLAESSLLEQDFVKDSAVKVAKLLADAKAACAGFERFEVGEGIDKGEENFAEEVRKQLA